LFFVQIDDITEPSFIVRIPIKFILNMHASWWKWRWERESWTVGKLV